MPSFYSACSMMYDTCSALPLRYLRELTMFLMICDSKYARIRLCRTIRESLSIHLNSPIKDEEDQKWFDQITAVLDDLTIVEELSLKGDF